MHWQLNLSKSVMLLRRTRRRNAEGENVQTILRSGFLTQQVPWPSKQMVAAGNARRARRLKQAACDLLGIPLLLTCMAITVQSAPVLDSISGHYYQVVVPDGGINWNDAKSAAASMTFLGAPGHLATITSAEENQFILSLFDPSSAAGQAWLGGFQPSGSQEPAGGWQWITGEPWVYTNWYVAANGSTEPNNDGGNENVLGFYFGGSNGLALGRWNDFNEGLTTHFSPFTYVVEFEPQAAAPEPKFLTLIALAIFAAGSKRWFLPKRRPGAKRIQVV